MKKCTRCLATISLVISLATLVVELYRLKLMIDERRERNRRNVLIQKLNDCVDKLNAKVRAVRS
jgi:hypothetical protein